MSLTLGTIYGVILMIRRNGNRKAFTLVELMVVVAMIAMIIAAMITSIAAAKHRTKVQKALSEVKIISQAILAYENYNHGDDKFELPPLNDQPADKSTLGFLLGDGGQTKSGKIPALLIASLNNGEKLLDPWGTPYKVRITKSSGRVKINSANSTMRTGFIVPNHYHLTEAERK